MTTGLLYIFVIQLFIVPCILLIVHCRLYIVYDTKLLFYIIVRFFYVGHRTLLILCCLLCVVYCLLNRPENFQWNRFEIEKMFKYLNPKPVFAGLFGKIIHFSQIHCPFYPYMRYKLLSSSFPSHPTRLTTICLATRHSQTFARIKLFFSSIHFYKSLKEMLAKNSKQVMNRELGCTECLKKQIFIGF